MYPDITKTQIVAIVQAVIALLAAFGLPITHEQSVALIGCTTAIAAVLVHSDAKIRYARNLGQRVSDNIDEIGEGDEVA